MVTLPDMNDSNSDMDIPSLADLLQIGNVFTYSTTPFLQTISPLQLMPVSPLLQPMRVSSRQQIPPSSLASPSPYMPLIAPMNAPVPSFPSIAFDEMLARENMLLMQAQAQPQAQPQPQAQEQQEQQEHHVQQQTQEQAQDKEPAPRDRQGPKRPWAKGWRRRNLTQTEIKLEEQQKIQREQKKIRARMRREGMSYVEREERRRITRERARMRRMAETLEEAERRRKLNRLRMAEIRRRERECRYLKTVSGRLRHQQHNIRCLAARYTTNDIDASAMHFGGSAATVGGSGYIDTLAQWATASAMATLPENLVGRDLMPVLPNTPVPDTSLAGRDIVSDIDEDMESLFGDSDSGEEMASLLGDDSDSGESDNTTTHHATARRESTSTSDPQAEPTNLLLLPAGGTLIVATTEEPQHAVDKTKHPRRKRGRKAALSPRSLALEQRQREIDGTVDRLFKAAADAAEEDAKIKLDPSLPLVEKLMLTVDALSKADEVPSTATDATDAQHYLTAFAEISAALVLVEVLDAAIARGDTEPVDTDAIEDMLLKIEALIMMTAVFGKGSAQKSGTALSWKEGAAALAAAAAAAAEADAAAEAANQRDRQRYKRQCIRKHKSSDMHVVQQGSMASPLFAASQCLLTPRSDSVVSTGTVSDSPQNHEPPAPRHGTIGTMTSQIVDAIMFPPLPSSEQLRRSTGHIPYVHCVPSHSPSLVTKVMDASNSVLAASSQMPSMSQQTSSAFLPMNTMVSQLSTSQSPSFTMLAPPFTAPSQNAPRPQNTCTAQELEPRPIPNHASHTVLPSPIAERLARKRKQREMEQSKAVARADFISRAAAVQLRKSKAAAAAEAVAEAAAAAESAASLLAAMQATDVMLADILSAAIVPDSVLPATARPVSIQPDAVPQPADILSATIFPADSISSADALDIDISSIVLSAANVSGSVIPVVDVPVVDVPAFALPIDIFSDAPLLGDILPAANVPAANLSGAVLPAAGPTAVWPAVQQSISLAVCSQEDTSMAEGSRQMTQEEIEAAAFSAARVAVAKAAAAKARSIFISNAAAAQLRKSRANAGTQPDTQQSLYQFIRSVCNPTKISDCRRETQEEIEAAKFVAARVAVAKEAAAKAKSKQISSAAAAQLSRNRVGFATQPVAQQSISPAVLSKTIPSKTTGVRTKTRKEIIAAARAAAMAKARADFYAEVAAAQHRRRRNQAVAQLTAQQAISKYADDLDEEREMEKTAIEAREEMEAAAATAAAIASERFFAEVVMAKIRRQKAETAVKRSVRRSATRASRRSLVKVVREVEMLSATQGCGGNAQEEMEVAAEVAAAMAKEKFFAEAAAAQLRRSRAKEAAAQAATQAAAREPPS